MSVRDDSDTVVVFTDASCSVKDLSGGWAFVADFQGRRVTRFGHAAGTTVNAMELTAIRRVLEFVALNDYPLTIYTDSQYAIQSLLVNHLRWRGTGGLTSIGEAVKNYELILDMVELMNLHRRHRKLELLWTKGHVGDELHRQNEYADKLAHIARTEKKTNWVDMPGVK